MKRDIIEGKIQGNERGYAFLIPDLAKDGLPKDYFISHSDLKDAMHGDMVLAETREDGLSTTARVLKIVKRGITHLVGTYFYNRHGGYVVPDDSRFFKDIYITDQKGQRAKSGDKVVVRILSYPKRRSPEGIVTKVLGRQFEKQAELKSILFNYELFDKFTLSAIDEANNLPSEIPYEELSNRKDLTNLLTFTIDGEDARDFDDAVSIEKTKNGYSLGVHIADVSHYVKESGEIDNEAYNRGCSTYFPEQVLPMLPEKLSNDLCSLVEGKVRLTLSCLMNMDFKGNVVDFEITPSYIVSKARMTYTDVDKIIEGDEQLSQKYSSIVDSIACMSNLADILHAKRSKNGCIDLDVKESSISVDKKGKITVETLKMGKARSLIEEFMIATNVTVAEYVYHLDLPFVYRVHDKPTMERVESFFDFIAGLGLNAKHSKNEVFSKYFQNILEKYKETPYFTLINRVMLRSMQKAKYNENCLGHFGLSEKFYCHFTSPIRRYPDLVIHRIIKDLIKNGSENLVEKYGDIVVDASVQSSNRERVSIEAERAVDDYYKLLYISEYEGEEFVGTVSGVTNFGVFVELDNGIEGLVRIETLKGKKYFYDKDKWTLSNGKETYRLGQRVKIKVQGVNLIDKKAQFSVIYE